MSRARFLFLAAFTSWLAHVQGSMAEEMILKEGRTHLRSGALAEWTDFARSTPRGSRLDLAFVASSNATEATLFLQQDDVRHDWIVELNGRRLGKLFLMEADLIHTLVVPPGTLKNGTNTVSILPPRDNDDVVIGDVRIDSRPKTNALSEAVIDVTISHPVTGGGLPCRITIVNQHGTLAPLIGLGDTSRMAVRPGVVYSGDGLAKIGLPAGDYMIYGSRGFEWSVVTQAVHLAKGASASVTLHLNQVIPASGWVSCDTHVHTFTHSRHGDATERERMLTLAGEGIELPISTEHNLHVDYREAARRAEVTEFFTPVTGNEVTTPAGHFNIFPVDPSTRVPNFLTTDWSRLMLDLRATPQVRVVVLNHPRNVHGNFQPFAATNFNAASGDNLRGPEFTFDAMEVLNSSAQQSDYMLVYRDWFALLNHGYRITAVGSSDGHDVSRYIVGQSRTYIRSGAINPGRIDVAEACSNLLAGRALVSMGLLADMTVDDQFNVGDVATGVGSEVRVRVDVLAPPWSSATNVSLFANGVPIRSRTLNGRSESVTWTIPRPSHDVHLVAIATGPGVTAPYWAIPRPYQPSSPEWHGRVIASTNPIWLDADSDGKFSAARDYARRLLAKTGTDTGKLMAALSGYDEAVSVQAASLSAVAGRRLDSPEFSKLLMTAGEHVRRGIGAFAAATRLGITAAD